MAPSPFARLLHLAAFCHLCSLLAGQQHGVGKCKNICQKMTSRIPKTLLIAYQESCGSTIILETKQHRSFCADAKEQWVQDVMKHLDLLRATTLTQNGGKFEKLVNMTSGITLPTRGLSPSAPAEPKATVKGLPLELTTISQEAHSPMGTSQKPPAAVTGSSSLTSKAQDSGLVTRPQSTEIFEEATISTTIWQSSTIYQSESRLQVEEKSTEPPSTTVPSTQATTLHATPEENVGSEVQPTWVQGQSPSLGPEEFLGPEETSQAHTDDFQDRRPGNTVHPSAAPTSSEGTPSQELMPSDSWLSKSKEPIPATSAPQKRSVFITPVPYNQTATRRQAVGLLAFLGLLFCLGVAMFAYQSLQGCPRKMAGEMVEGLRYVPRSCGSNSYVLVPV
ncbi:fractalkine [Onychomys torridus]|uniref:fractalkine n=1 Tax=Onychomys torridus TaxID=38674 RepID=UPI00167F7655|nr:fractalkine [Onychomys torridus]